MTITHEPAHTTVHKPVDVYVPRQSIRVDTTFWQHRSIFAGSQEQLNELRREADARAAARARAEFAELLEPLRAEEERPVLEAHRPVFKRLKPVIHVGLVPLLWAITTCRCGQRWPCNDIKQYLRARFGWTADITTHLKTLTDDLPKPATRWSRLRRFFGSASRQNPDSPPPARGR